MSLNDDDVESQSLSSSNKCDDRKPSGDDPVSDYLLKTYYRLSHPSMAWVKYVLILLPFAMVLLFTLCVSNSSSNVIAFSALVVSLVFIGISMWMLCWILDKD